MPTLSTLRSVNVATPLTAETVLVPDSIPPAALPASAIVTLPVKLGIVFPRSSCALTFTAGLSAVPATALLG